METKESGQARARASMPVEQTISAQEAIADEKPRKKKKKKKRSDGSRRSSSSDDAEPAVTTDGSSRSRRVSETKPGAYNQVMELEEEIARKSRRDASESSSVNSSKPGAFSTDQLSELEARIAAKSRAGGTRRSTNNPGVSSQLDDLESKIAAKSRRESRGSRSLKPGAKEQLEDLEDKIAAKSQRESMGTRLSKPGAKEQLDDMESKIAAKSRRESSGSRSSVPSSGAKTQLEDLESRIAVKSGHSSVQEPLATTKQEAAQTHDAVNPADNVIPDWMDSFADYSNFKFDDDPDKVDSEQPLSMGHHGIFGEPGNEYNQYPGGNEEGLAVAIAVEDDEDDVFIPAAIEYDPDAKPPIYKNRRFRLYSLLGCILVTAVVVAVSVVVPANKGNNDPTPAPTSFRETIGIQDLLKKVVGDEKFNDPESPYARAADWIINDDPLQLEPGSYNLIQRYLLAMFYFSATEKGPWKSCNPPAEGENNTCAFKELLEIEPELTYGSKEWIRWLSGENECAWAGVFCDENNYTAAIELCEFVVELFVCRISCVAIVGCLTQFRFHAITAGQGMTGTLPEELKELNYLQSITLDWNGFYGQLPANLTANKHLLNIELHYNFFTGTIPSEWFNAQSLYRINVGGNMLTGTISSQIGRLDALKGFFTMENMMSGTIPNEFANLKFVCKCTL